MVHPECLCELRDVHEYAHACVHRFSILTTILRSCRNSRCTTRYLCLVTLLRNLMPIYSLGGRHAPTGGVLALLSGLRSNCHRRHGRTLTETFPGVCAGKRLVHIITLFYANFTQSRAKVGRSFSSITDAAAAGVRYKTFFTIFLPAPKRAPPNAAFAKAVKFCVRWERPLNRPSRYLVFWLI